MRTPSLDRVEPTPVVPLVVRVLLLAAVPLTAVVTVSTMATGVFIVGDPFSARGLAQNPLWSGGLWREIVPVTVWSEPLLLLMVAVALGAGVARSSRPALWGGVAAGDAAALLLLALVGPSIVDGIAGTHRSDPATATWFVVHGGRFLLISQAFWGPLGASAALVAVLAASALRRRSRRRRGRSAAVVISPWSSA